MENTKLESNETEQPEAAVSETESASQTVGAPKNAEKFTVAGKTENSVTLEWEKTDEEASYCLYRFDAEAGRNVIIGTTAETSFTVGELAPDTSYTFRIKSFVKQNGKNRYCSAYASVSVKTNAVAVTPADADGLEAVGQTQDSISLKWNEAEGATHYRIYKYDPAEKKNEPVDCISGKTEYTFTGLDSGTTYKLSVRPMNNTSGANVYSGSYATVKATTLPSAVENLTAEDVTMTTVTLRWSRSSGASSYRVYMYDRSNGSLTLIKENIFADKFTVRMLAPETLCVFRVKSVRQFSGNVYESTSFAEIEVETGKPVVPGNAEGFEAAGQTTDSVMLKWNGAEGATHYRVYRYDYDKKKNEPLDCISGKTEYCAVGLDSGTTYKFSVRPMNNTSGANVYSESYSTLKATTLPLAAENFSAADTAVSSVSLKWDSVKGASFYRICTYDETSDTETLIRDNVAGTEFTAERLEPETHYIFRLKTVRQYNGVSYESPTYAEVSADTGKIIIPANAEGLEAVSQTVDSISIKWNAAEGATHYRIYKYDNENKKNEPLDCISGETEYTVKELKSGTAYKISVRPFNNESGTNVYSEVYSSVKATTLPADVEGFSAQNVTMTSVTLRWDKVSGAASYRIYSYDAQSDTQTLVRDTVFGTEFTVDKLIPSTVYTFRIKSVRLYEGHSCESVNYSETSVQTEKIIFPDNADGIEAVEQTVDSIRIKWNDAKGATGYSVSVLDGSGEDGREICRTTDASCTVTGLESGTVYRFGIHPFNDMSGADVFSDSCSVVNAVTLPANIEGLCASQTNMISVTLKWNEVKGATLYRIFRFDREAGRNVSAGISSKNEFTVKGLTPDTSYTFRIRAYTEFCGVNYCCPLYTSIKVRTEKIIIPENAANLEVVSSTTDSVTVRWDEAKGATHYRIYKFNSETKKNESIDCISGATEYTVKGLESGTFYRLGVRPFNNQSGSNVYSPSFTGVRAVTLPEPADGLEVSELTSDSVSLRWNEVKGASGYGIYVHDLNADNDIDVGSVSDTGCTVTGLDSDSDYTFFVRPYRTLADREYYSPEYTSVSVRTKVMFRTYPVSRLKFISTESSVTLSWDEVVQADGYIIYRRSPEDGEYKAVLYGGLTEYTEENLDPACVYGFAVAAFSGEGQCEAPDENAKYISANTLLNDISGSITAHYESTLCTFNWNAVKGADSYLIYTVDEKTGAKTEICSASDTSYTASGLAPDSAYKFGIRPHACMNDRDVFSRKMKIFTVYTSPAAPSSCIVTARTRSSVTLSWNAVNGASGYKVYMYTEDGRKCVGSVEETSFTFEGLDMNSEYRLGVAAFAEHGGREYIGAYTGRAGVRTSQPEISSYNVIYGSGTVAQNLTVTLDGTALEINTDYTVAGGDVYEMGIYTVTVEGTENCPFRKTVTARIIPQTPVYRNAVKSINRIEFSFTPVTDCTAMQLQISTSPSFGENCTSLFKIPGGASSKALIYGELLGYDTLRAGKTVYFRFRAYKNADCGTLYGFFGKTYSAEL